MAAIFRDHLMDEIMRNDKTETKASKAAIDRFAKFLYFLPNPSEGTKPSMSARDFQFVQPSQQVLKYLASIDLGQQAISPSDQENNGDDDNDEFTKLVKKKCSQKQKKQAKHFRKPIPNIDRKPFLHLGEDIPTTDSEVRELRLRLLTEQKELLGVSIVDKVLRTMLILSIRSASWIF